MVDDTLERFDLVRVFRDGCKLATHKRVLLLVIPDDAN